MAESRRFGQRRRPPGRGGEAPAGHPGPSGHSSSPLPDLARVIGLLRIDASNESPDTGAGHQIGEQRSTASPLISAGAVLEKELRAIQVKMGPAMTGRSGTADAEEKDINNAGTETRGLRGGRGTCTVRLR